MAINHCHRFERQLYVIRRQVEKETTYVCSCSSRTIVYKGLLMATQIERFYPDLSDSDFRLGPAGSVFVMFRPDVARDCASPAAPQGPVPGAARTAREAVPGPWRLTFPFGKTFECTALFDWSQAADDDVRYFSGRALYETTVASGGLLDLGVTGRKAFSAWRHYTKDDALLPSGLLGPVTLSR